MSLDPPKTAETTGHYAETSTGTGSKEANQVAGFSEATQAVAFTWATCASKATHAFVIAENFNGNWQAETSCYVP